MNLRFKQNAIVIWTSTNLTIAEAMCEACRTILGTDYVPMVTSGQDGTHSAESGHYYGRALDFRSHDIASAEQRQAIVQRAQLILGNHYWVNEYQNPPHFHIQRQKNSF